jgi:hypothetical protein
MLATATFQRRRQEDYEFKANLGKFEVNLSYTVVLYLKHHDKNKNKTCKSRR